MSRHRSLNALEIDISEPWDPLKPVRDALATKSKSNWEKFKDLVKKGAASKSSTVEQKSQTSIPTDEKAVAYMVDFINKGRKAGQSDDEIEKGLLALDEECAPEHRARLIAAAWKAVGGKKATKWYTSKPVLIGAGVVGVLGLVFLVKRKKALAGFEGTRRKRKRRKARR